MSYIQTPGNMPNKYRGSSVSASLDRLVLQSVNKARENEEV